MKKTQKNLTAEIWHEFAIRLRLLNPLYHFAKWYLQKKKEWAYIETYGVTLFFGNRGKGKTYGMVKELVDRVKQGHDIYVNFDLKVEGHQHQIVRIPFSQVQETFMLINYAKRPDSKIAVLGLDEGWAMFDSYEGTRLKKALRIKFISLRKHRMEVYMTAQRVSSVHKALRDVINEFWSCSYITFKWIGMPWLRLFKEELYELDGMGNLNMYQANAKGKNIALLDVRRFWMKRKIAKAYDTMEDIGEMMDIEDPDLKIAQEKLDPKLHAEILRRNAGVQRILRPRSGAKSLPSSV